MGTAGSNMAGWRGHLRVYAGFPVLLVGLILAIPGVPGPGTPMIIFGLVLLSARFPWAKRLLVWGKRKWSQVRLGQKNGPALALKKVEEAAR
jgi:hypothetical protein